MEYAQHMKFSQPTAAREVNRLRVLNLLAGASDYSRADIARILDLNKPSTSEIIEQLLNEGIVEETGKKTTATGRRPTSIHLKSDSLLVLGVDMGSRNTSIGLSDLKGNLLRFERFPTNLRPKVEELCRDVIKSCMKMAKLTSLPIAGITVAVNGVLSEDKQVLVSNDIWDWRDVPLAQAIETNTKIPTSLVNNVEAMVNAHTWFSEEPSENFLFINWAEHIGCAWVSKNLITSEHTQFGHLPIAGTGLCRCGNIGCLETVAAGWAISERHMSKSVKQISQAPSDLEREDLINACQSMAMALIAASAITGCDKIVLGGGIANLEDEYLQHLIAFYRQHAHSRRSQIPIVRSPLKEKAGLMGSIATALDTWVFKRSLLNLVKSQEH